MSSYKNVDSLSKHCPATNDTELKQDFIGFFQIPEHDSRDGPTRKDSKTGFTAEIAGGVVCKIPMKVNKNIVYQYYF